MKYLKKVNGHLEDEDGKRYISCHMCGGYPWFSVKEYLPLNELVIVYIPTLDENKPLKLTAWHEKEHGWSLISPFMIESITHWMPLPDNPESD